MIKNIVFDMGQVLEEFNVSLNVEAVGVTDSSDKALIIRELYQSIEWSQLDSGSITPEEGCDRVCKRLPQRLHEYIALLTYKWDRPERPIPGTADLCKELKANGYNLYLLSNANIRQEHYWPHIPGNEYFDGKVVSGFEGVAKPFPEIYQILFKRFNLIPDECVFIDDSIKNCETALDLGMHPIVFHGDQAEVRQKLIALGVLVSK